MFSPKHLISTVSSKMSWKMFLRVRRLPPTLLAGGFILTVYVIIAITGPFWAPYNPTKVLTGHPLLGSSPEHIFGTDQLGRDVFSRVVYGTREVLFLSLSSTITATLIGGLLGLTSGLLGGWIDQVLMRILEMIISIPLLIFALLIIAAAGSDLAGNRILLIGTVALVYIPRIARIARSSAIDLATRNFVTAAKLRGESTWSVVWREIAPNASGVLLVEFGVRAGYAPIFIGSMSFLGFGVRPPTPEWGLMISESRNAIISDPITVLAPAIALAVLVIGLNLFSDGIARVMGRSTMHGSN